MTKLMGKKIGDSHTETSFAKMDLPKETRVMGEGDMATMDHKPDRYVRLPSRDSCFEQGKPLYPFKVDRAWH